MKRPLKCWFGVVSALGLAALGANAATPGARFAAFDRARAEFSATATSRLGGGAGEVGVQRHELEAGGSTFFGSEARLAHGIVWARTELDRTGAVLLPSTLQEAAVRLAWQQTIGHYREVRVGVGAMWTMNDAVTLGVDVGMAVDQRFEFHERGVKYRGSDELFAAVAVSGKF